MATVATKTGKSLFASRIKGEGNEPKYVAWGTNPATLTATANDIAFFTEGSDLRGLGTMSLVKTTVENDTYQVVGTQKAEGGEKIIKEAGLCDSSTQPFKTTVEAGSEIIGSNSATKIKTTASYTPANGTYIQIRTEVLEVTAGTGTKEITVVRAKNGTAAISTVASLDALTVGNVAGPYSTEAKAAAIAGATLVTHADLGTVTLNTGDSIQWTWQVQFS